MNHLAGRSPFLRVRVSLASVLAFVVLSLGAVLVPSQAEESPAQQAYVSVTVLEGEELIGQPHLLVRVGGDAAVDFPADTGGLPRFGLKVRVDPLPDGRYRADVTGLVDQKEVAFGTLDFTAESGDVLTLVGGNRFWRVHADLATPALWRRLRGDAP
jgi:hypothetical protein